MRYVVVSIDVNDPIRQTRGWKLLMLLPRMLLHRPSRGRFEDVNKASECPPNIDEWIMILGTPVGSDLFVLQATTVHLEEESRLWEAVSWVPTPSGVLGRFSFSAQAPGVTTSSELCLPRNRLRARMAMMMAWCEAARVLDHAGFVGGPIWAELRDGKRPPPPVSSEPGEWHHGW